MQRADVKLFEVLADTVSVDLLQALVDADDPLTQSQLAAQLAISSGLTSRRMGELEGIGIVERRTSHGPYAVVFPEATRDLLIAVADLAADAIGRQSATADSHRRELKKKRLDGGRLRDRAKEAQ